MQKVPLNFITAMQSKRLQNYNRYQIIYLVDKTLLSPINAWFTLKPSCKRKALLQHQKLESNRLFPAHGNKTSYLLLLRTLLHFRGPYRRTEIVCLRKPLVFILWLALCFKPFWCFTVLIIPLLKCQVNGFGANMIWQVMQIFIRTIQLLWPSEQMRYQTAPQKKDLSSR